jgi:hypothetical protein
MKYDVCPICGKKGIQHLCVGLHCSNICKYCGSSWTITRWQKPTKENHWNNRKPVPQEMIDTKFAELKRRYLLKKAITKQTRIQPD